MSKGEGTFESEEGKLVDLLVEELVAPSQSHRSRKDSISKKNNSNKIIAMKLIKLDVSICFF